MVRHCEDISIGVTGETRQCQPIIS